MNTTMWVAIIVGVFLAGGLVWFFARKDLMGSAEDKKRVSRDSTDAPPRDL